MTKDDHKRSRKKVLSIILIVFSFLCYMHWENVDSATPQPSVHRVEVSTDYGRRVDFFDDVGMLCVEENGYYSTIKKYCDSEGKIISQYYFLNDEPVAISEGQYGMAYDYDSEGRQIRVSYLNKDGRRINNVHGVAYIDRTFYNDGSIKSERYYDAESNPARLSEGQYGKMYIRGVAFFLNKNGKVILNINLLLRQCPSITVIVGMLLCVLISVAPKKNAMVLFALYSLLAIHLTLCRQVKSFGLNLAPFWSYVLFFKNNPIRFEILNNIWLFVPIGSGFFRFFEKKYLLVAVVSLCISLVIEGTQWYFKIGFCEIDDVISNTIGGLVGYFFSETIKNTNLFSSQSKFQ